MPYITTWMWSICINNGCDSMVCHQVELLIYRALSLYLLLLWPGQGEGDQQWDSRAVHHQRLLAHIIDRYKHIRDTAHLADSRELQDKGKDCRLWAVPSGFHDSGI